MAAGMPVLDRRTAAGLAAVLLLLFALCTVAAATGRLNGLDRAVASAVHPLAPGTRLTLSRVISPISVLGSMAWIAVLALAAAVRPAWRSRVVVLGAAVIVGIAAEIVLKLAIDHPGPSAHPNVIAGVTVDGSYPSGNTIRGTLLVAGTAILLGGRGRGAALTATAVAGICFVTWSSVLVELHWASDVVGGLLLALAGVVAVAATPETG